MLTGWVSPDHRGVVSLGPQATLHPGSTQFTSQAQPTTSPWAPLGASLEMELFLGLQAPSPPPGLALPLPEPEK